MTMPQVITALGPALDKNQGNHLNRMMIVLAFKYRQHIRYSQKLSPSPRPCGLRLNLYF